MQVNPLVKYGKLFGQILILVLLSWQAALQGDGRVDLDEGLALGATAANGALTYLVPNFPRARWIKNAINAVLALLALGALFWGGLANGLDSQEVAMILITLLGGLGVLALPAVSDPKYGGAGQGIGTTNR